MEIQINHSHPKNSGKEVPRKRELPCTQQTKCFMNRGIKHNLPVPNIINPIKGNREPLNSEFPVSNTFNGKKLI